MSPKQKVIRLFSALLISCRGLTLKAQEMEVVVAHRGALKAKNQPEWIESAKNNHIILNAWTVDDVDDMDWFLTNGFDYITTNEPELLFERIKE